MAKKFRNNFRYLRHTADVSFFAYGNTKEECFKNASNAMLNLMFDLKKIKKRGFKLSSIKVKEKAGNLDDLLWFFLQKTLSLVSTKSILATELTNIKISKKNNKFYVTFNLLFLKNPDQKYFIMDVKAVTPHELVIKYRKNIYRARVILDI